MELTGEFYQRKFGSKTMYTCVINYSKQLMTQRNVISTVLAKHSNSKYSNLDVKAIWFEDFIMSFLPQGLTEIFPNIEAFAIIGCDLQEISRHDLEEFTNLKFIYLHYNKITSLPLDLFEGKHQLQEISIIGNKELRAGISLELFRPVINNGLKYVDLSGNGCVNAFCCPRYKGSLESIEQLMMAIDNNNETETVDELMESEAEDFTDHVGEAPESESGANTNSIDDPADDEAFENEEFLDNTIEESISISIPESSIENVAEETEELITIVVHDSRFQVSKKKLTNKCAKIAEIIRRNPETNEIEIKSSPETVQNFVDFINTSKVPGESEAISLYKLAAMLKVVDLEVECEEIILENLTVDNIVEVLQLGNEFRSFSMKREAIEKALEFFPTIIHEFETLEDIMKENFNEFIALVHRQNTQT